MEYPNFNLEWQPAPGNDFKEIDDREEIEFLTGDCLKHEKWLIELKFWYSASTDRMAKEMKISPHQIRVLEDQLFSRLQHKASKLLFKELTSGY